MVSKNLCTLLLLVVCTTQYAMEEQSDNFYITKSGNCFNYSGLRPRDITGPSVGRDILEGVYLLEKEKHRNGRYKTGYKTAQLGAILGRRPPVQLPDENSENYDLNEHILLEAMMTSPKGLFLL